MNSGDGALSPDINALIIEKLGGYPVEVRDLAIHAVRLSESLPEAAVVENLHAIARRLARQQEGGDR